MPRLLVIMGATATGKSELAMRLASETGAEIVSADALQIYRGLDIGTAKPTPEMRRRVRHHLLDVCDPRERFSAGEYAVRAGVVLADLDRRGKPGILAGGSGLYLRALLDGLSPLPQSDTEVRRALEERLERQGLPVLYAELQRLDPVTAERLAPGDRQRILRALEVERLSGRPLSSWIRDQPMGATPLEHAERIGLTLPRGILYDRIADRVGKMMERGWVAEVENLLRRGARPEAPAFQAIGYRQLIKYLHGEWSLEEAVTDITRATRRYAKRQQTWFRKEKKVRWIPADDLASRIPGLLSKLT
ncbi:MAG: tRNA (adenosine(37)-N6)-dimethylallyltransferase MiaA [Thermoanaerobaculia bacterium]